MNIKLLFAILSTLVGVFGGYLPYLREMFRHQTKPHAYTWLIWSLTSGTAVAGLLLGQAGWGALALSVGTVFVFVIFLFSFKFGTKNITKGDTVILVAALSAILVWWKLHNPFLAVFMVSIIDVAGYIPSFRKTFQEPWTEAPTTWFMFTLMSSSSILALKEYNFLSMAYLIAITVANILILSISVVRRKVIPQAIEKAVY